MIDASLVTALGGIVSLGIGWWQWRRGHQAAQKQQAVAQAVAEREAVWSHTVDVIEDQRRTIELLRAERDGMRTEVERHRRDLFALMPWVFRAYGVLCQLDEGYEPPPLSMLDPEGL